MATVRQVWGLDSPAWLPSQVGQESAWVDKRVSSAGARGLTQFIPSTSEGMERLYPTLAGLERYSPRWAFWAQAFLMRDLYGEFGAGRSRCDGIRFAGSAYNGGGTMLNREVALCVVDKDCDSDTWEGVATKNARAGWAYRENRGYVHRITQRESAYADTGWGRSFCSVAGRDRLAPIPD